MTKREIVILFLGAGFGLGMFFAGRENGKQTVVQCPPFIDVHDGRVYACVPAHSEWKLKEGESKP